MRAHRLEIVDQFRGIAVLLMAIFHFCYDLSVFGFIDFKMNGGFFTWFRFLIVTLFFVSIGAGLYLAHHGKIQWRKFWIREAKITAGALIITLATYWLYPKSWVWFGVLHFIALASVLALPFIFIPSVAAISGVVIFALFNLTDWFNLHRLWLALREPLNLPNGTQDLTRLIPWLGMVLMGIYAAKIKFLGLKKFNLGTLNPIIQWLSKHSLAFYLLHQPPLFAFAWLLHKAFH